MTTKKRTVRRPGPAFEELARRAGPLATSVLATRRHCTSTAATSAATHLVGHPHIRRAEKVERLARLLDDLCEAEKLDGDGYGEANVG